MSVTSGQAAAPVPATPKAFSQFLKELGRSRKTGQRWRNAGVINTVDIFGKAYVLPEEITRFNARVAAGEFARKPSGAAKVSHDAKLESEQSNIVQLNASAN